MRTSGGKLLGRGETGGAWEWTSTVFEPHEGFNPGRFYPEYSSISFFFLESHAWVNGCTQATFLTESIISSWEVVGLPIPGLPAGGACKFSRPQYQGIVTDQGQCQLVSEGISLRLGYCQNCEGLDTAGFYDDFTIELPFMSAL